MQLGFSKSPRARKFRGSFTSERGKGGRFIGVNSISEFQSRCEEEVRMMCSINHPNVVATVEPPAGVMDKISEIIRSVNCPKGTQTMLQPSPLPFLYMEYCPGGDARALLKRPENLYGLQETQVRTFLIHISDAIIHLHDMNIIHRDIKPENIIIQFESSKKAIFKLSDLGLAKDVSSKASLCSSFVGTLSYIAPEIFFRQKYDKMVDYWSFGLIAFEIACGILPFSIENSLGMQFRKHLPLQESSLNFSREIPQRSQLSELFRSTLSTWVVTMLQRDPLKRGKCPRGSPPITNASSDVCALRNIRQCLNVYRLEIHTPSGRFAYAINSSTRIPEVQTWLSQDTSIDPKSQLLLTRTGTPVKPNDLASKYSEKIGDDVDLFLVNKFGDQLSLKIMLPQILSAFLRNSSSDTNDPEATRKLWTSAINYVQTQLSQTSGTVRTMELLKLQHNNGSENTFQDYKQLQQNLKDKLLVLKTLVELEVKLEEVEDIYEKYLSLPESRSSGETAQRDTIFHVKELLTVDEPEEYSVKPLDLIQLKQFYKKLLEEYGLWRSAGLKKIPYSMNTLRTLVCLFISSQQTVLTSINSNVKYFLRNSFEHQEKLLNGLSELDNAIDDVVTRRLKKQETILKMACPILQPNVNVELLSQNFNLPHLNFQSRNWNEKSLTSSKKEMNGSLNSVGNDSNHSSSDNAESIREEPSPSTAPNITERVGIVGNIWDKIEEQQLK
ncbi:unnamed protein product [Allacma fusca]|uniref:IkappaB kinase n=1 Tax=Allacma fusca TaxID=39272 RepID=A0A8J2LI56_9HEXA|nr:unnamed protein product [Allacma fusca]